VEIQSNPETAAEVSFLNQSVFTNDPTYLLRSAYSTATQADKGGYNWSYYSNPTLDAQLDEVRTITDEAARSELVGEMQRSIIDDHVAIYVIQPLLAQPVREEWDVAYETLDYNYVVRFFYARRE
jgi:peptide/nickel transport system substrate-binding protein